MNKPVYYEHFNQEQKEWFDKLDPIRIGLLQYYKGEDIKNVHPVEIERMLNTTEANIKKLEENARQAERVIIYRKLWKHPSELDWQGIKGLKSQLGLDLQSEVPYIIAHCESEAKAVELGMKVIRKITLMKNEVPTIKPPGVAIKESGRCILWLGGGQSEVNACRDNYVNQKTFSVFFNFESCITPEDKYCTKEIEATDAVIKEFFKEAHVAFFNNCWFISTPHDVLKNHYLQKKNIEIINNQLNSKMMYRYSSKQDKYCFQLADGPEDKKEKLKTKID